jgi:hypothetical protein
MDTNSTNFPVGNKNMLLDIIKKEYTPKEYLKYEQFIVYKYLCNNPKSRGILLFHEMGVGKSITAISLAEYYRINDTSRKIIVLLSKSLQSNFKNNIKQYLEETKVADPDSVIEEKYKFISLNASNMYDQISRSNKTLEELQIEKQLKEFTDIVVSSDFLENSVLIIDEYHNLSNSITNGSYNAIKLYDIIMKTKNIKLIFLTGTPIINSPFELVPTFNMLNPVRGNYTLFPELEKDFNEFFIDYKTNSIKNAGKFKNRILGMVSYYGSLYTNKKKPGFPEELKLIIERVPMSSEQFVAYNTARDYEIEEASIKQKRIVVDRFASKSAKISSYRVKSRQISNFLIPEYALGPARGKKMREKYISKIKNSAFNSLDIYSPKIKKMLSNINTHKNQLGLIYTEFVAGEGIAILERVLQVNNYANYMDAELDKTGGFDDDDYKLSGILSALGTEDINNVNEVVADDEEVDDVGDSGVGDSGFSGGNSKTTKKKYAVITGNMSFEHRENTVKVFNDPKNKYGAIITLLLISKTGAEGLDLKNIRHVHILEPFWNYSRILQVIARAVRYKSHDELKKAEQNVQPYIYLSNYPIDYNFNNKKEETTDIDLFDTSLKNKKLIDKFYLNLAEVSVDCSIHQKKFDKETNKLIHCHTCNPDNKPLYDLSNGIAKQILLPDPCKEMQTNTIKAHGISIPGRSGKYYYKKNKDGDFSIFKYNESLQGYVIVDSSEPIYSDILRKLLKV